MITLMFLSPGDRDFGFFVTSLHILASMRMRLGWVETARQKMQIFNQ